MPRVNAENATPVELAWSKVASAVSKAKNRPTPANNAVVSAALAEYGKAVAAEFLAEVTPAPAPEAAPAKK